MAPTDLDAIIVAAGSSKRMGFDKLTVPLAGRPLLQHSLQAFEDCADVGRIVLVCAGDRLAEFSTLARPFAKVSQVVPGGRERVESVLAGVAALPSPGAVFIAIHDGARPLITPGAITACYQAAREVGAAACAQPVTDTLHRSDATGLASETVVRKNLWAMQTPQIATLDAMRSVLESAQEEGATITDEISLLVRSGVKARLVENKEWNLKVTYPRDLELAEMILQKRTA